MIFFGYQFTNEREEKERERGGVTLLNTESEGYKYSKISRLQTPFFLPFSLSVYPFSPSLFAISLSLSRKYFRLLFGSRFRHLYRRAPPEVSLSLSLQCPILPLFFFPSFSLFVLRFSLFLIRFFQVLDLVSCLPKSAEKPKKKKKVEVTFRVGSNQVRRRLVFPFHFIECISLIFYCWWGKCCQRTFFAVVFSRFFFLRETFFFLDARVFQHFSVDLTIIFNDFEFLVDYIYI